jgi:hypothetical protein
MDSIVITPPEDPRAHARGTRLLDRVPVVDERGARRSITAQIARLDAELGALLAATRNPDAEHPWRAPSAPASSSRPRRAAPRLLSLADLERQRDDLADRVRTAQRAAAERADVQEEFRVLREEMLLDPDAYRNIRVSNADIGEPGCLDWHVQPRFGVLGRLMNWWRVRISSGCP